MSVFYSNVVKLLDENIKIEVDWGKISYFLAESTKFGMKLHKGLLVKFGRGAQKNIPKWPKKSKMAAGISTILTISLYPFVFLYMSKKEKYCYQ